MIFIIGFILFGLLCMSEIGLAWYALRRYPNLKRDARVLFICSVAASLVCAGIFLAFRFDRLLVRSWFPNYHWSPDALDFGPVITGAVFFGGFLLLLFGGCATVTLPSVIAGIWREHRHEKS